MDFSGEIKMQLDAHLWSNLLKAIRYLLAAINRNMFLISGEPNKSDKRMQTLKIKLFDFFLQYLWLGFIACDKSSGTSWKNLVLAQRKTNTATSDKRYNYLNKI